MVRKYHIDKLEQPHATSKKSKHEKHEDKLSKPTSSLFPIKMIAKLELT